MRVCGKIRFASFLMSILTVLLCWQIAMPSVAFAGYQEQTVQGDMTIIVQNSEADVDPDVVDDETTTDDDATDDTATITPVALKPTSVSASESASLVSTGDSILMLALGFLALCGTAAYVAQQSRMLALARGAHTTLSRSRVRNKIVAAVVAGAVLASLCFGAYASATKAIADDAQVDLAKTSSTVKVDATGKVLSNTLETENISDLNLTIKSVTAPTSPAQFDASWTSDATGKALGVGASVSDPWKGTSVPSEVVEQAVANNGKTTVKYSVTVRYFVNEVALTDEEGKVTIPDPITNEETVIYINKVVPNSTEKVPLENVTVEVDEEGNVNVKFDDNSDDLGDDEKIVTVIVNKETNTPVPDRQVTVTDKDGDTRGPSTTGEDGTTSNPGYNATPDASGETSSTDPTTGKEIVTTVTYKDATGNDVTVTDYTLTVDKTTGVTTITIPTTSPAVNQDITVKVVEVTKKSDGTEKRDPLKDKEIVVEGNNGEHGPKSTGEDGSATYKGPSYTATTEQNGQATTKDTDGKLIVTTVTYINGGAEKAVEGATVTVDETSGNVTVKLPEGETVINKSDIRVVVEEKASDGTLTKLDGKNVTVEDDTANPNRGTKETGSAGEEGESYFPGYTVTVTYVSEDGGDPITVEATVNMDEDGNYEVVLPKNFPATYEKITVHVADGAGNDAPDNQITLKKYDGTEVGVKSTEEDGNAVFPGNIVKTEDGKVTIDGIVVTVSYDKDGDEVKVDGAIVTIDDDGKVTVKLPEGSEAQNYTTTVNVSYVDGTPVPKDRPVELDKKDGTKLGEKKTDAEGDAIFPAVSEAVTTAYGSVTIPDPSTGKDVQVIVTYKTDPESSMENSVSNATVIINSDGDVTVKLPGDENQATYETTVKIVVNNDGYLEGIPDKNVTLIQNEGSRGTKTTDDPDGKAIFPATYGKTDTNGQTTISDVKEGKALIYTVTYVPDGGGDPIKVSGAKIKEDNKTGVVKINLPSGFPTDYENITVNVQDTDGNMIDGIDIDLYGESLTDKKGQKTTDTDGNAIWPGHKGVTGEDGKTEIYYGGVSETVIVSYVDTDNNEHLVDGATVDHKGESSYFITLPEGSDANKFDVKVKVYETETKNPLSGVVYVTDNVKERKNEAITDGEGTSVGREGKTKEDGTIKLNDTKYQQIVTVKVSYLDDDGTEKIVPDAYVTMLKGEEAGNIDVKIPEDSPAYGKTIYVDTSATYSFSGRTAYCTDADGTERTQQTVQSDGRATFPMIKITYDYGDSYTYNGKTYDYSDAEVKEKRMEPGAIGKLATYDRKDSATIEGWYTSKTFEASTKVTEETVFSKDTTLYCNWKNTMTVSFDADGGEIVTTEGHASTLDSVEVNKGDTYKNTTSTDMPVVQKTGYSFDGWCTNVEDDTTKVEGDTPINATTSLVAKWIPNTYTIHFDGNGGEDTVTNVPEDMSMTYGTASNLPETAPTRENYIFKGWTATINGETVTYAAGAEVKDLTSVNGETITLKAKWVKEGITDDYFLAPANSSDPEADAFKGRGEILADVAVLCDTDHSEYTAEKYNEVLAEYTKYMWGGASASAKDASKEVHLYTKIGNNTNKDYEQIAKTYGEGNQWFESRIIDLGQTLENRAITFQATHVWYEKLSMSTDNTADSSGSTSGWANSGVRKVLNNNAETSTYVKVYSLMNQKFVNDVATTMKLSTSGDYEETNTATYDKFWTANFVEMCGDSTYYTIPGYDNYQFNIYDGESSQYEYFKQNGVAYDNSIEAQKTLLAKSTRNGRLPGATQAKDTGMAGWDTRSQYTDWNLGSTRYMGPNNYMSVNNTGTIAKGSQITNNSQVICFSYGVRDADCTVSFDTGLHGTAPNSITVKSGATLDASSIATPTCTDMCTFEGWYKDSSFTNAWNFDTDVVDQNLTLYAKWTITKDNTYYWMAPSAQLISGDTFSTGYSNTDASAWARDNKRYNGPEADIIKNHKDIEADIAILQDTSNPRYQAVYDEYMGYMIRDDFHLYCKLGTGTSANDYGEFRIVQVGEHDGDNSALTFQATHVLSDYYCAMTDEPGDYSHPTNERGWVNSYVRADMLEGGAVYGKFPAGLIDDMAKVEKKTTLGTGSTTLGTTMDRIWIMSLSEQTGSATYIDSNGTQEGSRYEWFNNKRVIDKKGLEASYYYNYTNRASTIGSVSSVTSYSNTEHWYRSPRVSSDDGYWWQDYYCWIDTGGRGYTEAYPGQAVVPCFALGTGSTLCTVQFVTRTDQGAGGYPGPESSSDLQYVNGDVEDKYINKGEKITLPKNVYFEPAWSTGKVDQWFVYDENYNRTDYWPGDTITVTSDMTIYANWSWG